MAFPPNALPVDYQDSTAMATIHPGAHNTANAAINDIVTYLLNNVGLTQENVEDFVGGVLRDSAVIDVTYDDTGNLVSFTISPGSVTSAMIANGTIVDADVSASAAIAVSKLGITGTPDGTKYLRDDNTWQPLGGATGAAGGDLAGTYPNPTLAVDRTEKTGGGKEVRQSHGNTGATETIDLVNGNVHVVAQDQACTYTFTGFTNGVSCSMTLIMTAVTGAATWPAAVKWSNGTAPTLTGVCVLTFVSVDGGTTIYGFLAGSGMA